VPMHRRNGRTRRSASRLHHRIDTRSSTTPNTYNIFHVKNPVPDISGTYALSHRD
jgi:hypothetical protein